MQRKIIFLFIYFFFNVNVYAETSGDQFCLSYPIYKKVLNNGLIVLVRPLTSASKVSVHMFYHVGSKDEKSHERGKAHMLEHMVFKGTANLSEVDIPLLERKLAAYTNAATSHDFTTYCFDLPRCYWHHAIAILADCMTNCTFKPDLINSELKVVIQELKMYKDRYERSLFESLISTIFEDHPYHYPLIGYKQDLWNMSSASLHAFYKKHYVPNNATLVVVGDVDPEEVFSLAEKSFGHIPKDDTYAKENFYFNKDIAAKTVTIYRDVQRSMVQLAFVVPGIKEKQDFTLDAIDTALAGGKSSRLHKRLVDDLRLVTSINSFVVRLFDHSLFYICFESFSVNDIDRVIDIVQHEISLIAQDGLKENELQKVRRNIFKNHSDILESYSSQANTIGKYFLATNDEYYAFKFLSTSLEDMNKKIKKLVQNNLRPSLMHKGFLFPLLANEKDNWIALQQNSDREDTQFLNMRVRESQLESGQFIHKVHAQDPTPCLSPKAEVFSLKNGIKVFSHKRRELPKVHIVLELKADGSYYDPDDKQGLYSMMSALLLEGTTRYSVQELADLFEEHAISLRIVPGSIVMDILSEELEFALELLNHMITQPIFKKREIEKVRKQILVHLEREIDNPGTITNDYITQEIYAGHPFSKKGLGDKRSIKGIKRRDILNFYRSVMSPDGVKIAIVGDFDDNVKDLLERTMGGWKGKKVTKFDFPEIHPCEKKEITHYLNRDQVCLSYAGLSIKRTHPDFDKLALFDLVFAHGMSSKLFELREKTGIFYGISGATAAGAGEQPGIVYVQTQVSLDRLAEAEELIKKTIEHVVNTITEEEFNEAKQQYMHALVTHFSTNAAVARSFLFLDRYQFSHDFFDNRLNDLKKITLENMKEAVVKVLKLDNLITVKVGRLT